MTETIIFLCGVLSGLVTLLLGYFIRMGLLHNKEIINSRVDINNLYRVLDEQKQDIMTHIKNERDSIDKDVENLHKQVGFVHTQIEEANKYTDKRVDKIIDKFGYLINNTLLSGSCIRILIILQYLFLKKGNLFL